MNWTRLRSDCLRSRAGRLLLSLLAAAYGAAVRLRGLAYSLGMLRQVRLPVRVVCIGNVTAGGTGKTTAVLQAARELRAKGAAVAILSRGYRRKSSRPSVLLDADEARWEEFGDEPCMMHRALRGLGVPILVGADRAESGRRAVRDHSPSVILLDDGFQHRRLARDADIVLVSALDPFGGGLLPLGRLREPARGLSRASLIVLTHCEGLSQERLSGAEAALRSLAPGVPIARAEHRPEAVFDLKREERLGLSRLKGQRAASLCALGDPAPFEGDLRRLGAEISQAWRYPDHHPFTLEELRAVEDLRAGATVVTTLKDFPRLPAGWRDVLSGDVLALEVRLELRTGREFWEAALFHGKP